MPQRLRFIHAVLRHAVGCGVSAIVLPVPTCRGETFTEHDGFLWELSPWAAGSADFSKFPTDARLRAAMRVLAQFHRAAETFPPGVTVGLPPAVPQRLAQIRQWRGRAWGRLRDAIRLDVWPELSLRAPGLLDAFQRAAAGVQAELEAVCRRPVPLLPCIRDIWHDHVFFSGDEVTGLIDFGAMRIDTASGDLARLLGSLVGDDPTRRAVGISAYEQVRPLSAAEWRLVEVLDHSEVLLSGINWLDWVFLEGRQFDQPAKILGRIDRLIQRSDHLVELMSKQGWSDREHPQQ